MIDRQKYMLNSIGMNWIIGDPYEEEFEILVEYRNKHGHCDVPGDEGVLAAGGRNSERVFIILVASIR